MASGNFSMTAAICQAAALLAARHLPQWELIDYAGGTPEPYVAGTLIAARKAPGLVGLTRGLDALLLQGR